MPRRAVVIRGLVQGVGFRPFLFELANRHNLSGFVRNDGGAVHVEVEGENDRLDQFCNDLSHHAPPLAVVNEISWSPLKSCGETTFRIECSASATAGPIYVSPDVATCDDCLAELADPADRRYRYPFLNCTNCGPRLTIVRGAPYDRARTTMAGFAMCPACRAEYLDPINRRFHAQPTACPQCGPQLAITDSHGEPIETGDAVRFFVECIRAGKIGALKGLGGYHLVCDASSDEAVRELRRRKHRDEKPFAVMVPDVQAARKLGECSAAEEQLLSSRSAHRVASPMPR